MARIRTIKPSFFTSLTVGSLPIEARLTFAGLWTHCDDEGRCVYDPRLLKAALWPLDERGAEDVADDIALLVEAGLVTHYIVKKRSFLAVNGWAEHQRINRPTPSILPCPQDGETAPIPRAIRLLTSRNEGSVMTQ